MEDYIILPRSMLEHKLFSNPEQLGLWIRLLALADESGNINMALRPLAAKIGTTYAKLRILLQRACVERLTTQDVAQGKTKLTILNIGAYGQLIGNPQRKSSRKETVRQAQYIEPEKLPFSEITFQLASDQQWRESVMRSVGINDMELDAALSQYPSHCIAQGEQPKTIKEAKFHITNWLRRQRYSKPFINNETNRQDRFSERRGTDPSANRAEDYAATL